MNFGILLLTILYKLLEIYTYVIIAAALVSWIFLPPTNPVLRFLRFLTEPVFSPCRQLLSRILPSNWRRFDFSPILALLAIQLVQYILGYIISALKAVGM
jgi:YggT family protein